MDFNVSGKTVLVVEDEPALRRIISEALKNEGLDVAVAEDGKSALKMIKEKAPDVILSDLVMPELTGGELLNEVRRLGLTMPFIILTGNGQKARVVEAMRLGAFDFLEKPVSNAALVEVIVRALKEA